MAKKKAVPAARKKLAVEPYAQFKKNYLAGHYDSTETNIENRRHWGAARDLPVTTITGRDARVKARVRAIYEEDNNTYCSGMIDNITTDLLGSECPQLQIISSDAGMNSFIESEWERWAHSFEVNLPSKLKITDRAKRIEGEGYNVLFTDDEVGAKTGYFLNFNPIASRRFTDPQNFGMAFQQVSNNTYNDDGVIVDLKTGRPVAYKIITEADEINGLATEATTVPARYVTQWFQPKRAGQYRGISEIQAALPLFAYIRRFELATLSTAEIIACMTAFMKTQGVPASGPTEIDQFSEFPITRGMLKSLPDGWEPIILDPKQPAPSMEMFVNLLLRSIGRVLNIPFGIMVGDSSKYNYSSARLDYRGYEDKLKFDKRQLQIRELNPIYYEWKLELGKANPTIARAYETNKIYHKWRFATRPSIDPEKDAKTENLRLANNTTTLAEVYADRGEDWEQALEQRKKEMDKIKELGLDVVKDYTVPENTDVINQP